MKTVLFICILAAFCLSNVFAAPEWKPYDDFEGDLDTTVDPGEKTEWKKEDIPSNADLGEFPWWSIYLTADQVVKVAVDDVFVKSESLPYPVEARGKLASLWGEIKLAD